jgi:hypothetical protein
MALGTTLSETFSSCMCDTNQQARENKSFALLENHNRDSNHFAPQLNQSTREPSINEQCTPFPRPDIVSLLLVADSPACTTTTKIKSRFEKSAICCFTRISVDTSPTITNVTPIDAPLQGELTDINCAVI